MKERNRNKIDTFADFLSSVNRTLYPPPLRTMLNRTIKALFCWVHLRSLDAAYLRDTCPQDSKNWAQLHDDFMELSYLGWFIRSRFTPSTF